MFFNNSTYKAMKTTFLMLTFASFIGLCIFSCSNESDFEQTPGSIITTRADSLIATPAYQRYSQAVKKLGTEIRQKYSALPDSKKQEFKNKLAEIQRNDKSNLSKLQTLTDEAGEIIGINYDKEINTIKKLAHDVFKGRAISRKELIIALKKNKLRSNSSPVIKTMGLIEDLCPEFCEYDYIGTQGACDYDYLLTPLTPAEDYIICSIMATNRFSSCLSDCGK